MDLTFCLMKLLIIRPLCSTENLQAATDISVIYAAKKKSFFSQSYIGGVRFKEVDEMNNTIS